MAEFKIKDFEACSEKVVSAPGIVEAMFEYLPWPHIDVAVKWLPSSGLYHVLDKQTDFKYEVTLV